MEQTQSAAQEWDALYGTPATDPMEALAICEGVQAADEAEADAAEEGAVLDDEALARITLKAYREWLANPAFTP